MRPWLPDRRAPLSCRELGRLLHAYLDGELRDSRAVLVADHLDACMRCGLEADSYRWLKAQLTSMAPRTDERQLERLRDFAHGLIDQPT